MLQYVTTKLENQSLDAQSAVAGEDHMNRVRTLFCFQKLPPCTLAGFDLTTHSSRLLGGRRRQNHYVDHAARATKEDCCLSHCTLNKNISFFSPAFVFIDFAQHFKTGVDVMIPIYCDFRQFSAEKGVFLKKTQYYDKIFA
jgi:hypothetical protein